MSDLATKIEAVLFLSTKPLSLRRLGEVVGIKESEARAAVEELMASRNVLASGVHVLLQDNQAQLVTNPALGDMLAKLSKEEIESELTRPQLETLTIVAYRGPITKPEVEQIRGVNCALILRNLLMRGLIEEREDSTRLQNVYVVTTDFLRHLGMHELKELPDYEALHGHAKINQLIEALNQAPKEV
jgi:segregation and condensation protein B